MKKLVATSILACAIAAGAFAQGTVVFQNSSASVVQFSDAAKAALGTTAVGPAGTAFLAELYYAPTANDAVVGGQMGVATPFLSVAGRFTGGTRTTPSTTAGGTPAWFEVRVWEAAYGATYDAAVRAPAVGGRLAIAGASPKFSITTGTLVPTPITAAGGLNAPFQINPVPEPSTIALGLVGLAGLFVLRRRNS